MICNCFPLILIDRSTGSLIEQAQLFCPWTSAIVPGPGISTLKCGPLSVSVKSTKHLASFPSTWLGLNSKTHLSGTKHLLKSPLSSSNLPAVVFHWIPLIMGKSSLVVSQQFEANLCTDLGAPRCFSFLWNFPP